MCVVCWLTMRRTIAFIPLNPEAGRLFARCIYLVVRVAHSAVAVACKEYPIYGRAYSL